jgi:uncharacterized membrane protein YeaQ/YmgE (transglycosylase-associated protein family)
MSIPKRKEGAEVVDLIVFILVGLVVGALARLVLPGKQNLSIIATILVGVVGAIVGGYLWRAVFGDSAGPEWIGSILLAVVVLMLLQRFGGSRST